MIWDGLLGSDVWEDPSTEGSPKNVQGRRTPGSSVLSGSPDRCLQIIARQCFEVRVACCRRDYSELSNPKKRILQIARI